MDKLQEICKVKRTHVEKRKAEMPLSELEILAKLSDPPRGFEKALRAKESDGHFALIAELKKASPSKGMIRKDFNHVEIAKAYEAGGATALSVLTDVEFFQGNDQYLVDARKNVSLPILRKDFIIDPYQVIESRALGADAILLIVAALSDDQLHELEWTARRLGMDVLVEVHDRKEMLRALTLKTHLIGINNRNLKTLEVDLNISKELARLIPGSYLRVCESGIFHNKDMIAMRAHWFNTFLVGESLMAQGDVEKATRFLLNG